MTKPSTTHVIEIQTGIGEPAFIPLSVGQELQPISLGKKGMWKIESARVLDVHAFMYFDGAALFLQSADPSAAAAVDGQPVGKSWTELHAPCVIDIGSARLRFYNLAEEAAERAARQEAERREAERREAERLEAERREAERREAERREAERRELERRELERREGERRELERREAARREAERRELERRELERRDYERRVRAQTGPPPLEGYPIDGYGAPAPHGTTRHEGGGRRNVMTGPPPPHSSGRHYEAEYGGLAPEGTADMPLDPMLAHGGRPRGGYDTRHGPSASPVPGIHPMHPGMSPMGPGSGIYNPHATGSHPTSSPYNSVPPGYGSMTGGQVGGPPPGGLGALFGGYKELSTPKRVLIVLAPFCLAAAGYLVLFDTPPQTAQTADAGEATWTSAPGVGQPVQVPPVQPQYPPMQAQPQAPPPAPLPQPPAQPQPAPPGQTLVCPTGYVPYPQGAQPGGLVPCVPLGGAAAPPAVPSAPAPAPPPPAPQSPADPSAAAAAALAARTLERQAVDFVAVNDYAHAAAVYEVLQQQNPSNRVYAEAARILRAKADGGVP